MKFIKTKLLLVSSVLLIPIIVLASNINNANHRITTIKSIERTANKMMVENNQSPDKEETPATRNAKIEKDLKLFASNKTKLQKKIKYKAFLHAYVFFTAIGLTVMGLKEANVKDSQNIDMDVIFSMDDNNQIHLNNYAVNWKKSSYNFLTGFGADPWVRMPHSIFNSGLWGNVSPLEYNPSVSLPEQTISSPTNKIDFSKIDLKIKNEINGILASGEPIFDELPKGPIFQQRESRFLGTHTAVLPTGGIKIDSTATLRLEEANSLTDKYTENHWKEQIGYKFNKNDIFNYVNAWFDPLTEEDKKSLNSGYVSNNVKRPWNYGDISNKQMPTLFNFNSNLLTLVEIDKITDLITEFLNWANMSPSSSGWQTAISDFLLNVVNQYKFDSYDTLKEIYDDYFKKSNNGQSQTGLKEFKNLTSKMISSEKKYAALIEKLKKHLKENNITIPVDNENKNQYYGEFKDLALLSKLTKGFLISNDIKCDINVKYTNNNNEVKQIKVKDRKIYNAKSSGIDSGFFLDVLSSDVKEENINGQIKSLQTISIENIRAENALETKFFNQTTKSADSNNFTILNNIKNISINYKAESNIFSNFSYAAWTKNKDAIGISINKYLSEIIHLNNNGVNYMNDLNPGMKDTLLKTLNGEYKYSKDNQEIVPEIPVYLKSQKIIFKNEKNKFLSSVIGGVGINDIDNFFKIVPNIDKKSWINAWSKFKISLDDSNQYPLIVPTNEKQEFFIIGQVDNFFSNSDYDIIRKGLINNSFNNVKPIALINHKPVSETDSNGYFLLKLKTCFDNDYNLKPSQLRRYRIEDTSLAEGLNNFIKKVLIATDENNKPIYWIEKKIDENNESFFQDESWTESKWILNYNKIWYDLLQNPDIRIISSEERKQANEYILTSIKNVFIEQMETKYGIDSIFMKELNRNLLIDEYLGNLYESLINSEYYINDIPYIFNEEIWNQAEAYTDYQALLIDPTVNSDKLEKNAFNNFFSNNATDHTSKYTNIMIEKMFSNLINVKDFLLSSIRLNSSGVSSEDEELINNFNIQFNKYKSNFNNTNPAHGGDGYDEWCNSIKSYLDSINIYYLYNNEFKLIFNQMYGNNYIENLVNNSSFITGNTVNQNLIFASIDEMLNDEIIQEVFNFYNLKTDDFFEKTPLTINNNIIENEYKYKVKNNNTSLFSVNSIYIDNVEYFTFNNTNGGIKIASSIELLNKIANVQFIDNNNQQVYKVLVDEKPLLDSLIKPNDSLNQLNKAIKTDESTKQNYSKTLNIGSIVIVSVLPFIIILVVLLSIWLLRAKKRKLQF